MGDHMTRHRRLIALALGASLVLGAVAAGTAATAHSPSSHGALGARAAFHDAMRKLWEDHITWTRQFIVSAGTEPGNLPDLQPTVDRLLANQADIGAAIAPYYGEDAGAQLTALLRTHILTAADLLAAAKAGDAAATEEASDRWYANAHDIAVFLHDANPSQWPLADLDAMMKSHLDLTLEEAVARLEGRYADDIAAYDKVHADMLEMADMLSDGIVAQFPSAFAR
jgi:hypothetical protein